MTIDEYRANIDALLQGQRVTAAVPTDYAAHYTGVATPRLMLTNAASNSMRQFDGDYMNDPEEGRYLVDVMLRAATKSKHKHKEAILERLRDLRSSRLLYSAYQKCTFLSCWTTTSVKPGEEEGSDSLNHWRFYGDDGKGSCLMVPLANLLPIFPNQLYRVIYGTETRGGGTSAATRPVRLIEEYLVKRFDALRITYANAMADLEQVIQETHPLLFLFKSSEYASEREVRSVVHHPDYASATGIMFDDRVPGRAYINGNPGVISSGSVVYFGPKADHKFAIETLGLASNLGLNVRAFISSKPYR